MAVTMKDVAERAGVGLGTVSNYLSGKGSVSKDRAKRIQASIVELGYVINEAARSLKSSSYKTIGVLIPTFSNTYLVRIVTHIEKILRDLNYSMLVVSAEGDSQKEKQLVTYLSQRVDGIIYMPTVVEEIDLEYFKFIQTIVPIITCNDNIEEIECDKILINNSDMAYQAVHEFVKKGHEKIGILIGTDGMYTTKRKLLGYQKALEEVGIGFKKEYVKYGKYERELGRIQAQELIESGVTAFYAAAYQLGLGALWTIVESDLENEIGFIGYDAEEIENIVKPKVSYVAIDHEEVAKSVVELVMLRVAKNYESYPEVRRLQARLINIDSIAEKQ